MRLHANAKLSVKGRELLVDRVEVAPRVSGWRATAARAVTVCLIVGPATVANRTEERRVEAIAALRRLRMTGAEIADVLSMAHSTVSGILGSREVSFGKPGLGGGRAFGCVEGPVGAAVV